MSATVARIADVVATDGDAGPGDGVSYVFDFGSLAPITAGVEEIEGAGYAAGIPDRAYAEAHGWDYGVICDYFGPESDGSWTKGNGKRDDEMNRRRMADWQGEYRASLEGIEVEATNASDTLGPGDWVVLSTFIRGTGQSIPGHSVMPNGVFVLNYFSGQGASAVTDYWDQMLERDPELLELMRANPGHIFEDSIEAISVSSFWSPMLIASWMPITPGAASWRRSWQASASAAASWTSASPTTIPSQATAASSSAPSRTTPTRWPSCTCGIACPGSRNGRGRPWDGASALRPSTCPASRSHEAPWSWTCPSVTTTPRATESAVRPGPKTSRAGTASRWRP